MKKIILFIVLALNFLHISKADTPFREKGTILIEVFGGYSNGASYYDLKSEKIVQLVETVDDQDLVYNFEFSRFRFGVYGEYSLSDDFAVFGRVPVSRYSLTERYSDDTAPSNPVRAEYTLFQPDYFALGGKYKFYDKNSYAGAIFEGRIPPGFRRGIIDDPDYDYLSDGAFEVLVGFAAGMEMETSAIESRIVYNFRDEELSDQVIIDLEAALRTVEDTRFYGLARFVQSTEGFEDARPYDPRETPLQSNYIDAGLGFEIIVNDLIAKTSYQVRLAGKNVPNYGYFSLSFGALIGR